MELAGEAQQEALAAGYVEMAFADAPSELEGFESRLLHGEPLKVVLNAGHPLVRADRVELTDLAAETLILHPRHEYPEYYDRLIQACRDAGFDPQVYHREPRQNCVALVAAGRGVLLAPAQDLHVLSPGLHSVALEKAPASLCAEVWGVLPRDSGSPRLAILRELLGPASAG